MQQQCRLNIFCGVRFRWSIVLITACHAAAISSSINVSDSGTNGNEKVHLWNAAGGANDYVTGKILVEAA